MIDIFGSDTQRLVRLLEDVDGLSSKDADAIADAWAGIGHRDRASAWAEICHSATPVERIDILNAALVARQHALAAGRPSTGRRARAFCSAAWDAGGAVVAAGDGRRGRPYRLLVSALASQLPWLKEEQGTSMGIPKQRDGKRTEVRDEPIGTPSGSRR